MPDGFRLVRWGAILILVAVIGVVVDRLQKALRQRPDRELNDTDYS